MTSGEDVLSVQTPSRSRMDRVGVVGAFVTAVLSFTSVADAPGSVFIAGACLFWMAFVVVRAWQDREVFRHWGFRVDNLTDAALPALYYFAAGTAGLAAVGWMQNTLRFPAHALPMFLVYSVWGLIQQFLMLGILLNNLEQIAVFQRRKSLLVLLVALIFGLVHMFNQRLVAATFLLELGLVALYLRHRNLWPLGVLHGSLGGLFYLWIENRDLWIERFG
jgi:hypothetical protein